MKVGKLDRRHNGYGTFKHYVKFKIAEVEKFCDVRSWCWDQWGASSELDSYKQLSKKNPAWAWQKDQYVTRLYFSSDAELQWFILKWM